MNNVFKYNQAKFAIFDLIVRGRLQVGDRLPSLRRMCSMFPVSEISIRRALSDLEAEGYIVKRHGSGVYLARALQSESGRGKMLFIQVDPVSAAIQPGVTSLRRYLLDRQIALETMSSARPSGDVALAAKDCIGIFASGFITSEWTAFLETLAKPVLYVGANRATLGKPCVGYDWKRAVGMATERLYRQGARRIGLLNGDRNWFPAEEISEEFLAQATRLGLPVGADDILWKTTYSGLEVGKFLGSRGAYDALVVELGALPHLFINFWQGGLGHEIPMAVLGSVGDHLSSERLFFLGFKDDIYSEAGKAFFESLSDLGYFRDGPRLLPPHFVPDGDFRHALSRGKKPRA